MTSNNWLDIIAGDPNHVANNGKNEFLPLQHIGGGPQKSGYAHAGAHPVKTGGVDDH